MTADEDRFDPRDAAALAAETLDRTRRSLRVRPGLVYAAWGLAWLVGLGVMWLQVRDQRPYRGPDAAGAVVLDVLLVVALVTTMLDVLRSGRGVAGPSRTQQAMYGWAWPVGFGVLFAVIGALGRDGADDRTIGTLAAVGPMGVTALVYVVGAALWTDRLMFALGIWLAGATAAGAFAGPVGALLVGSLAGGGGFLAAAVVAALAQRTGRPG